jgi:hypothetical protein
MYYVFKIAKKTKPLEIGRPCHVATMLLLYIRLFRNDDKEDLTHEFYFR